MKKLEIILFPIVLFILTLGFVNLLINSKVWHAVIFGLFLTLVIIFWFRSMVKRQQ